MDDFEDDNPQRRYWAQRHGADAGRIDLPTASRLFRSTVTSLESEHYFDEWTGYTCVDAGTNLGTGGDDLEGFAFRKTRLHGIWPPAGDWDSWDEEHLFTAIEFFRDIVAEPIDGYYHPFNNCGYHVTAFNRRRGRVRYAGEVNAFLADFGQGFELNPGGEVVRVVPSGLEGVSTEPLPESAGQDRQDVLEHAIRQFRARGSNELAQRDAIKNLVDLLESIRPDLGELFVRKDEADLFEIANRFNIRHRDVRQKGDYDPDVFLPWLFYSLLAAVHAAFLLRDRARGTGRAR